MTPPADPVTMRRRVGTPPWYLQAACRPGSIADPDIFFPHKSASASPARRVCQVCPVRAECLEFALRENITYGVWGGLTDRQRRRLRARVA